MFAVRDYFCKLNRSFAALHAALENRRVVRLVLVALLSIHTVLLGYSAYVHSPTLNEPGHLVAGLSYWKFGRFDVYSVNPPLVKLVAALPVMAVGYEEDWSAFRSGLGARSEFAMGDDFVAANRERSFFLFMIARWACIPFSWIGALVCYAWARDLFGRPSGVVAAAIWCFEPNILAHASLITSDAAGAALGVAACYTFWRWLKHPTWTQAAMTGVVLGLAELTKTTLIIFYPLWPLMWMIYRWPKRWEMTGKIWLREAGMLALRMAIGVYVVNLGYGFEGSLRPLGDFHFVSDLFSGGDANKRSGHELPGSDSQPTNRLEHSWLAKLPSPIPSNYLMGIDLQQRDFEHYGRLSYLRGEWRDCGWWYYYLYAGLIKIPLGLLFLGGVRAARLPWQLRTRDCRDDFVLLWPALVIFAVISAKDNFSEHFRYILPIFPLVFVWLSGLAHFAETRLTSPYDAVNLEVSPFLTLLTGSSRALFHQNGIAAFLSCWIVSSSVWIYPHSLSYFNEAIGGPLNGSQHLLGSNLDWGQDFIFLKHWLNHKLPQRDIIIINSIGEQSVLRNNPQIHSPNAAYMSSYVICSPNHLASPDVLLCAHSAKLCVTYCWYGCLKANKF